MSLKTLNVKEETLEEFRNLKPFKTISDDEFLNHLMNQFKGEVKKV